MGVWRTRRVFTSSCGLTRTGRLQTRAASSLPTLFATRFDPTRRQEGTGCMQRIVLVFLLCHSPAAWGAEIGLDEQLASALRAAGFTGMAGEQLERRLGRPVDGKLANLGRLLFF